MRTLNMSTFTYHKFSYSFFEGECEKLVEKYKNSEVVRDLLITPTFFNILDLPDKYYILGQQVAVIVLIASGPNHIAAPHTDGEYGEALALNIPISGCTGAFTRFYESTDPDPLRLNVAESFPTYINKENEKIIKLGVDLGLSKRVPYYSIHRRQYLKKVDELELTSPTLINVGSAIHEIVNYKKSQRVALSVRFFEDPWHWIPKEK